MNCRNCMQDSKTGSKLNETEFMVEWRDNKRNWENENNEWRWKGRVQKLPACMEKRVMNAQWNLMRTSAIQSNAIISIAFNSTELQSRMMNIEAIQIACYHSSMLFQLIKINQMWFVHKIASNMLLYAYIGSLLLWTIQWSFVSSKAYMAIFP